MALLGGRSVAQIPNGYYTSAEGKTGTELKTALHDIIKGHTSISYANIWYAFWTTDNRGNGIVWDMYSDGANYTYSLGQDQCGTFQNEGDCYNREHSWPQSWFGGENQTTPRTDLHHIFPTDGYVNQKRSNYPFGEVSQATYTSSNGSKLGTCATSGYSGTVFEPIDEYKGDFARALMYMSVRYYGEDSGWGTSGMTNKSEINEWAVDMLLRWNELDPVSQKETDRNNAIYSDYQHNRNPFVDHPEYARMIWAPNTVVSYAITALSPEHGSITVPASAQYGSVVTLAATPESDYVLGQWHVYKTGDESTTVTVRNNSFVMPNYPVTVGATFNYVGSTYVKKYYLVTSADQLMAGRHYLIVNANFGKALGTTQNTNNRSAASVTITDNVISTIGTDVCELLLGGQSGAWTFKDPAWSNNTGGYLYAAGGGNYLRTQSTLSDRGKWTIAFSNGTTTITSNGETTNNLLKYNPNTNNNNPIFSCYSSASSGVYDVCLFLRGEEYEVSSNLTKTDLLAIDKYTINAGGKLTVSGTIHITDPSHLIIKEGGQLVHHQDGVAAIVEKGVTAYSGEGGWYTIATPMTTFEPDASSGMLGDSYDLYAYDEAANKEWRNYKSNTFALSPSYGYLYARTPGATLRISGILNNGDYSATVDLSHVNGNDDLRGFNLLGNPTAHTISYTKTSGVSDGYYYLANGGSWTYTTSTSVPVGRGFLVKANADGQTVTLNPQSRGESREEGRYLCIGVDGEKAYVKMDEGVSMPVIGLGGRQPSLYLLRDSRRYAMLVGNGAACIDLGFEAQGQGEHTLTAATDGLGLDYLHLVDHKTGADVDLLAQPAYTFTSASNDYPSRFQLRFAPEGEAVNETGDFACLSNGQLMVQCEGKAILQVIDMLGRVVASQPVDGYESIAVSLETSGVYVLRLVADTQVKVQKIVVNQQK